MSDKTGFSLDVEVSPSVGFKPLPDLVAFDLCNAYPVPGGNLLLRNPGTGARAMVTPDVYSALAGCNEFLTLDQHIARIIESNPGMKGQQDNMRSVLRSMLDSGIMVSAGAICDRLKIRDEQSTEDKQTDKPVVVIITWERPEALERLLKSIHSNCNADSFHQLYVVDDSRKPENITKNSEIVAKLSLDSKMPVQYFGQVQQQSLLENLTRQLPEHEEAIRFLADQTRWRDQWTSGLARNFALLLSCGHRLVMLDDDTICDVYDPGNPRPDITFSDGPREADFFANDQEWKSQRAQLNQDPVNRHMQCLGLTVSESLNVLGNGHLKARGLTGTSTLMVSDLQASSPVLMTECGSFGCPGINTNTWLPDMAPASIDRMLASPQKTTNALNTRIVWAGRSQPHFSSRPNMSAITGLDNRQDLPPYFPILRGEDRLFGNLLNFIFPDAVTLDYPWAVPHLPIPQREWEDKDRDFTPAPSFPSFFPDQLSEYKATCQAEGPAERMHALAGFFSDLAAAPNETLVTTHHDAVLRDLSGQLHKLDKLLAGADSAPAEWQEYLQQGIAQLRIVFEKASLDIYPLKGQPRSMEGDELILFWKKAWSGFAAALLAWPEIREAATEIVGSK